ncbi:hypothetical protein, partial [Castellaniella sp. GW247-6E4]|uniref:hypothetical protein n=1 Tax=Castellaniella sp. GW247-6E4 TaxID=3140380 RepID=UPI0033159C9E
QGVQAPSGFINPRVILCPVIRGQIHRFVHTHPMDENIANQLLDTAIYLAHASLDDPDDETVLSLFEWLVHTYRTSKQALH